VLAQDESSVTILTVQPFAVLLRVPAKSASSADFSPDSQEVLFVSSITRAAPDKLMLAPSSPLVERWSIAQRKRIGSTAVRSQPCGTLRLSPDGRILGCVDFAGTLRFIDVASGEAIFEKKGLSRPWVSWGPDQNRMYTRHESGDLGSAGIEFSLDGRFVLAAPGFAYGAPLGWDSVERKEIRLRGGLRQEYVATCFAFVGPDRVLIMAGHARRRGLIWGTVVAFPSGEVLSTPSLPGGEMYRAADPNFVIFRTGELGPAVAIEYRTGQLITSRAPALDVLGNHYVAERTNGEIGLYERGKPAAVATVRLDAP
jgi:WD40 repeat protein